MLRGNRGEAAADTAYGVLGPTQLELTRTDQFDKRLWVQVLDPPN